MSPAPEIQNNPDKIADEIINKTGGKIVMALPLGLGKANHIANAIVARAVEDSSIDLKIFTALSLQIPKAGSGLKKNFLEPAKERLFGDYPELLYAKLLRDNKLPDNIQVNEFFFLAGQWLNNPQAQQSYTPANYTHALSYILERGLNVVAQLVAKEDGRFSMSCNPDIMVDLLKARSEGGADFIYAVQTNSELPFMYGAGEVNPDEPDFVLDGKDWDFQLYTAPKRPVTYADQAVGIHTARLVRDGGSLQIGIGSIGDAIAQALILRHRDNDAFTKITQQFSCSQSAHLYEDKPFGEGLYGVSEMFVDGLLQLAQQGIIKREVDGAILHGGFFVDCRKFYQTLREMEPERRRKFQMVPVSFTNELYGPDEGEKRAARKKASFINNAMMVTLGGATISDALDDGRVVSGVGGQYNFVAQAFALEDARSIITINATRQSKGKPVSNIVFSYGHITIPWHLRDIVVTEYGVADLRGKSEADAYKAMICIADSRFQEGLLQQSKDAGKIEDDWCVPQDYRNNTPERIREILAPARQTAQLPLFPFGTEFTEAEQDLVPALRVMKDAQGNVKSLARLFWRGVRAGKPTGREEECLERIGLLHAGSLGAYIKKKILTGTLRQELNPR